MGQSLPAIQGPRHPRRDWILGASAVGIFGLACVAAAGGVGFVAFRLLEGLVPHVVGLALAPWLLGMVWFLFFDLPRYVLIGGVFFGVGRLSQGAIRRFFWGLPLVLVSFAIAIFWPTAPDGLAPTPFRIEQTLRWSSLGLFLLALAASHLYSRKRRSRG